MCISGSSILFGEFAQLWKQGKNPLQLRCQHMLCKQTVVFFIILPAPLTVGGFLIKLCQCTCMHLRALLCCARALCLISAQLLLLLFLPTKTTKSCFYRLDRASVLPILSKLMKQKHDLMAFNCE